MHKPVVSIAMITYNHEEFIEQAINGVLMQECNFKIELLISNDNSPDNTDSVIKKILKNHPKANLIKYNNRIENVGMMPNFISTLTQCTGKFIALCEGDDYWTDPLKLQKQVDFLEQNKDYSICFHAVDVKYESNIVPFLEDINETTPDTTTIFDLLQKNYIHTPSVVFRNNKDIPEWLMTAYPGDWSLHIINATYGKIKFIKDKMATYRVHYGGVHSTTGHQIGKTVKTYRNFIQYLNNKNLNKESEFAINVYNKMFTINYRCQNNEINRFQKSMLFLKEESLKFKMLFLIPIIFNNSTHKVLKTISKVVR